LEWRITVMSIVAEKYAYVIGVDTHARTHTYAIINTTTGARACCEAFPVTTAGMKRAMAWIGRNTTGPVLMAGITDWATVTVAVLDGDATGTALIAVDRDGENQIAVCPGANSRFSVEGLKFGPDETVLCQLEVGLPVVLEAARRSTGFFVLNTAPAMDLPAELLERCDLVIVNETEYKLIPALAEAKLVAVTYGKEGSAMFEHGRRVAEASASAVTVANTIGAGDAFCAALVLALRTGLSYARALAVANAVGADAVGDPSSQPALAPMAEYVARAAGVGVAGRWP